MLLLPLLFAAVAAAKAAGAPSTSMEAYFSAEELVRIAGYGEEPVSTVLVSGQILCVLCLRPGSDLLTFQLPGSKVAVTCKSEGPNTSTMAANSAFATTDESGNFTIELPSRLHATPNLEDACSVTVLTLPPDSACHAGHSPGSPYRLQPSSSEEDGVRTYTTGSIWLQHNDTPSEECVQEESRSDQR